MPCLVPPQMTSAPSKFAPAHQRRRNVRQFWFTGSSSEPSRQSRVWSHAHAFGIQRPLLQRNSPGSQSLWSQSLSSVPSPQSSAPSQTLNGSVQLRLSHWNSPGRQWRTATPHTLHSLSKETSPFHLSVNFVGGRLVLIIILVVTRLSKFPACQPSD